MARSKVNHGTPVIKIVTVRGKPDAEMIVRIQRAAQIMVQKSWERGQAWKRTGMWGAFLEIYNCYMRLATLMEEAKTGGDKWLEDSKLWRIRFANEVDNVCDDMRNFTTLLQLAMDANKFDSDYVPPAPS